MLQVQLKSGERAPMAAARQQIPRSSPLPESQPQETFWPSGTLSPSCLAGFAQTSNSEIVVVTNIFCYLLALLFFRVVSGLQKHFLSTPCPQNMRTSPLSSPPPGCCISPNWWTHVDTWSPKVHSLPLRFILGTFYGSGQMYNDIYPPR